MAWAFVFTTFCSFLLGAYGTETCSPFSKQYSGFQLRNASQHTRDCPLISVESEEICIKEFCRIVETKKQCIGNAVQILKDGTGFLCYILQLHSCDGNGSPPCTFEKKTGSKFLFSGNGDRNDDYEIVCPGKHRCANGLCVENVSVCNGVIECLDGSDEMECPQNVTCKTPDNYLCRSDEKCVPVTLKCDGVIDCDDGSDEMGCTEYWARKNENTTLMITAISVGVILSLLLIVLMFACGQKLYTNHFEQRERLRNLRLGSSGADYVVRLLPGEAPFEDTLPPSYNDSVMNNPGEEPPDYEPETTLERLLDIAECSGYISPHSSKQTAQDTCSSHVLSSDSPGPSLQGVKIDSDLVTESQNNGEEIG